MIGPTSTVAWVISSATSLVGPESIRPAVIAGHRAAPPAHV